MKNWVIAGLCAVVLIALGVFTWHICAPKEFLGSASVYDTITLQVKPDVFYDVRVPKEAKLLETDGMTIFKYDLLTVGVQDIEPISFCKVKVANRWVFAASPENWYKATLAGFEEEQPYEGSYDITETRWTMEIPPIVMELDKSVENFLLDGASLPFGGKEFITTQVAYGVFDSACDRALTRLSTLYSQPIKYGKRTDSQLWVTSGEYTVAVCPINYNTCMITTACGDRGRQYAISIMEGTNEK